MCEAWRLAEVEHPSIFQIRRFLCCQDNHAAQAAALEKDQDPQAAEAKGSHFQFPIHVLTHFMTCEVTTSMVLNEALGCFVDAPRRNESTGLRTQVENLSARRCRAFVRERLGDLDGSRLTAIQQSSRDFWNPSEKPWKQDYLIKE